MAVFPSAVSLSHCASKTLPGPKHQVTLNSNTAALAQIAGALEPGGLQRSIYKGSQAGRWGAPHRPMGGPTTCSFPPPCNNSCWGGDWLVRRFLIWAQRERRGNWERS